MGFRMGSHDLFQGLDIISMLRWKGSDFSTTFEKNTINKIIIARLGGFDLAISADGQTNDVSKIHSSGSAIELS